MDQLDKTPVYITEVVFNGLKYTNPDFIKQQLTGIVQSKNMRQLLLNVSCVKESLSNLGIFKNVLVAIDTDSHVAREDGYRVVFAVKEAKKTSLKINASTSTEYSHQVGAHLSYLNMFGNGEKLHFSSSLGSHNMATYNLDFYKPLYRNTDVNLLLSAKKEKFDSPWSRFKIANHMLVPGISYKSSLGFHRLFLVNNWRHTSNLGPDTPKEILLESGSQFYRGLRHIFSSDNRCGTVFPDSGHHFTMTNELTTITPGSKSGLRSNAESSNQPSEDSSIQMIFKGSGGFVRRITSWLTAEWNFETNLAHSLTGHQVPIGDRFFLGGPLEFRGFQPHSLGPNADLLVPKALISCPQTPTGDSVCPTDPKMTVPVGAPGSWLSGLHLYTPLPVFGSHPDSFASLFRIHGFFLSGSTIAMNTRPTNIFELKEQLIGFPRVVTGIGLVMRFADAIRIELNYCIPVRHKPSDPVKPGFQFGIGVSHT